MAAEGGPRSLRVHDKVEEGMKRGRERQKGAGQIFEEEEEGEPRRRAEERAEETGGKAKQRIRSAHPPAARWTRDRRREGDEDQTAEIRGSDGAATEQRLAYLLPDRRYRPQQRRRTSGSADADGQTGERNQNICI